MDGWITIGTKLSTDKFERQMTDLENRIDSEEKKQELLNNKTADYERELENATRQVNELSKQYDNAAKKADELRNAMKTAPKGSFQRMELSREYDIASKKVDDIAFTLDKAEKRQESLNNKVAQMKLQYENSSKATDKLRGKIASIRFDKQNKEIKTLENGIGSAIKKVGKLALAVLSVRSAYSLLRQASSTWGQYNEQYAKDLEYIRFVLANALAPVLEKIVQLVSTLMGYINYLSKSWFGKAVFASAKDFENMSKSASGIAKSTNEIKNNIASFDELNVLSQSTVGGIGGGFLSPSFDLGEDVEIPEWLQWLGNNGDAVKNTLLAIGGALGALKLADLATDLGLVAGKLSVIKAIGIGVAIKKIADGVDDLKEYMDDPSLENLGKTITDIGEAVVGVGVATGNLPIIVGGALTILTGQFIENWDEIKETTQGGIDYLREKTPQIEEIFGETGAKIYTDILDDSQDILNTVDNTFQSFNNGFHSFIEGLNALRDGDWTTAMTKFKDVFRNIWDGISEIIRTKINAIIRFINVFIDNTENMVNKVIDGLNSIGANINHVSWGRIPILEKQDVIETPTQSSSISEIKSSQIETGTSSLSAMDIANSVAERMSNISQDITVKFEGTVGQFIRQLKPQLEIENKRAGNKIISGGAY